MEPAEWKGEGSQDDGRSWAVGPTYFTTSRPHFMLFTCNRLKLISMCTGQVASLLCATGANFEHRKRSTGAVAEADLMTLDDDTLVRLHLLVCLETVRDMWHCGGNLHTALLHPL